VTAGAAAGDHDVNHVRPFDRHARDFRSFHCSIISPLASAAERPQLALPRSPRPSDGLGSHFSIISPLASSRSAP